MGKRKPQHWRIAPRAWPVAFGATILLATWSQQSIASGSCTFAGATSETFTFPSPISVPRDNSASMAPLTPWVTGASVTNIYSCTSNNSTQVGIGIKFPSLAQAGAYSEGGLTYKVFKTSVPGVGVVYGYRSYSTGPYCSQNGGIEGWSGWLAASGNAYSVAYCYSETSTNTNSSFGAQFQVRLIQTGKITAGTMAPFTLTNTAADVGGTFSTSAGSKNYLISSVNFQALGCMVEGGNVPLDTAKKSDFASATSVNTKAFQFTLHNCPAGMNTIKYQLDPVGTIISATDGTFQNASGTDMAKGIGLRITNEANTAPIRFGDSSYVVSGYNSTSGNTTLPIKMNVSYYRSGTAAQVTGGKVSGTAQLTVFYL